MKHKSSVWAEEAFSAGSKITKGTARNTSPDGTIAGLPWRGAPSSTLCPAPQCTPLHLLVVVTIGHTAQPPSVYELLDEKYLMWKVVVMTN